MTVFKHGLSGYTHHGCRCDICASAAREASRGKPYVKHPRTPEQKAARKANTRNGGRPSTFKNHGTWASYAWGCRCPTCKAFKHAAKRRSCENHERSYNYRRAAKEPSFKVLRSLSARLLKELRRGGLGKTGSTTKLVGCTRAELRAHLSSQFMPGQSFENYGTAWHVDHIRPCASFDLSDPEQQRQCFHFTNLQPLWDEINLEKSDSLWAAGDLAHAIAMTPYPS